MTAHDESGRLTAELEGYRESKQWEKAIEALTQLVDEDRDAFQRAGRYETMAQIYRDELARPDAALDHFDLALDSYWSTEVADAQLQTALKPIDSIIRMLTTSSDWKSLDRAYRKMLHRLASHSPRRDRLQAMLYDRLGELYGTHLGMPDAAATCAAEARRLDPSRLTAEELRVRVDEWIGSGGQTYDPALALLAQQSQPPVAVYDDALARLGQTPVARVYLERALLLMIDFSRQAEHLADLHRAHELSGDQTDIRALAAQTLAQHYAEFLDDYAKAIPFMREALAISPAKTATDVALRDVRREQLATWLGKSGDHAAAIEFRRELAASGDTSQRYSHLEEIAKLHIKRGDLVAAEAVCGEMTEPNDSTAKAWLALIQTAPDPDRIKRGMDVLVRCWPHPEARAAIQDATSSARAGRGTELAALFTSTFFRLAYEGLEELREVEDTLLATPDNHLALAEELTRRGDPRGELIVVQYKLETDPHNVELGMRLRYLLEQNAFRWLGPLDTSVDGRTRWYRGYPTHAEHIITNTEDIVLIGTNPGLRFLKQLTLHIADDPVAALIAGAPIFRLIPKFVTSIWTPRTEEQRAQLMAAIPNIEFTGITPR